MLIRGGFFGKIVAVAILTAVIFSALVLEGTGHSEDEIPGPILLGENPRGIAINTATNRAVVTNESSHSVSIVDLAMRAVLSVVPVGKAPRGVTIDRDLNLALIGNSKDDTVSLLDLSDFHVIATLPVGKFPEGMAVDQKTHLAAVTNRLDHTVSFIDLNMRQVIATVPAGAEPIDVAILEAPAGAPAQQSLALVVNSLDRNVAVIDADAFAVVRTLALEKKPSSIDVNSDARLVVATNVQENSITVIDTKTWQTRTIPAGKHPVDAAIDAPGNRALVICDEDRTLVLVDLNTEEIVTTFDLNKLPKGVAVNERTGVAAVIDDKTDSLTLIQLPVAPGLPKVEITLPADNAVLSASPATVAGTVANCVSVTVNGIAASAGGGFFSASVSLVEGQNTLTAIAADGYGRTASSTITVTLATNAVITGKITNALTGLPVASASVSITDAAGVTRTAVTDGAGAYRIAGIAVGAFTGNIAREGYALFSFADSAAMGQTTMMDAALAPIPPVISAITVTDVTFDSARVAWTTDRPADSLVEYGETSAYGNQAADATLTTSHGLLLIGLTPSKTYHFRVSSRAANGAAAVSADSTFNTKAQIGITITSPVDGASITGMSVMVTGTVTSTANHEMGVTVNGMLASLTENRFVVSHVPLQEGANPIAVRAVDAEGTTATQSITVYAVATTHGIIITASPESGTAPLEIVLRVGGSFGIADPEILPTGPGPVEPLASASPDEYRYRMTEEGMYFFTVRATGPDNNIYQDTVAVTAFSAPQLDALLRAKWEGMTSSLLTGNIENAMSYFAVGTKGEYRKKLTGLGSSGIYEIFSTISDIKLGKAYGQIAMCGAIRAEAGGTYSYPLTFIKDHNGIWKIFRF